MKKILVLSLYFLSLALPGCQKPEEVVPTVARQGITSLTAIFTSGEYAGKEAVRYQAADSAATRYVIPVPWFYPDDSDNETTGAIRAMRVRAEIANNCRIFPELSVLDLTQENLFTFTEADGKRRRICITGERVKSDQCRLLNFVIEDKGIAGVIDQDKRTVSLISIDDLSECTAVYSLSPHAAISPDPAVTPLNFNEVTELTVTAHNGSSRTVYTVKKEVPGKIASGFRPGSETALFHLDLASLNLTGKNLSLGVTSNYLVVSGSDGTAPLYLNRSTGRKAGRIRLGNAPADGCIASDAEGTLLICNRADAGATFHIYRTNSVTAEPELWLSWKNASGFPVGLRVAVQGDLAGDAMIVATCEGNQVSAANRFVCWTVKDGTPGPAEVVEVTGADYWQSVPNGTKVVPRSLEASEGFFLGFYNGAAGYFNKLAYIDGGSHAMTAFLTEQSDGYGWAFNYNCLDAKLFNKAKYLALYTPSYFPTWPDTNLYLYDVSSLSTFSGTVDAANALVFKTQFAAESSGSAGGPADVLLAPTPDGYKLQVYVVDASFGLLSAYEFDCIDK